MLLQSIIVGNHPRKGIGLYSTEFIPSGTIVWLPCRNCTLYSLKDKSKRTLQLNHFLEEHGFYLETGDILLPCNSASYMNHSCNANILDFGLDFGVAIVDIEPNTEICCDYRTWTYDPEWSMACSCQELNCETKIKPSQGKEIIVQKFWMDKISNILNKIAKVFQPLHTILLQSSKAYPLILKSEFIYLSDDSLSVNNIGYKYKKTKKQKKILDFIGVGVGPSNLSLGALSSSLNINAHFFEKNSEFSWHKHMLLNSSKLQVHYLKDCVTLTDPTNQYSFLNFLKENNRIYEFLNKNSSVISRNEYNQYLQWVSKQLKNISYSENVVNIEYLKNYFEVSTTKSKYNAKNIVLGTGQTPYIPESFKRFLSKNIFHSSEYLYKHKNSVAGKIIAIIGGGQSGAEIVNDLLTREIKPLKIIWASKRLNFHPLENSCFANEYYTPSYSKYFYQLPDKTKSDILNEQMLTSDGISQHLIDNIYRTIYELKFVQSYNLDIEMLIKHNLIHIQETKEKYRIKILDLSINEINEYDVDEIIFATGYQSFLPECVEKLLPIINQKNGKLQINHDYSISLKLENANNKIYIQNGAKHTHGIADPNLSLITWRNELILNSILKSNYYHKSNNQTLLKLNSYFEKMATLSDSIRCKEI